MQNKQDKKLPVCSLETLLGDDTAEVVELTHVRSRATSTMKTLMLQNQQNYLNELNLLAKTCADLLNQNHSVPSIVHAIEVSMAASHARLVQAITNKIGLDQFEMNRTNPHTVSGKNLQNSIKAMKKFKEKTLTEITEEVVTDTLVQANKKFDANLGDFNLMFYNPTF